MSAAQPVPSQRPAPPESPDGSSARGAVSIRALRKVYREAPEADSVAWTEAIVRALKRLFAPAQTKVALDDLTLDIRPGELFGIVGSNGAGKTTLLKLLSCLLYPDGGTAYVNGYDVRRHRGRIRRSVLVVKAQGWLGTLWQLTGRENLLFRARMSGLSRQAALEGVDRALRLLEVEHRAEDYSWNWSTGEQQRINLAMSFVTASPVVFFDEPTAHLDPHAANLVRSFIRERINGEKGQTVLISTHYLEEAEALCDRVAILVRGRLAACGTPAELKAEHAPPSVHELGVEDYTPLIGEKLKGLARLHERFEDPAAGRARLRVYGSADVREVVRRLEEEGARVVEIRTTEPTLDDVFFCILERLEATPEGGTT